MSLKSEPILKRYWSAYGGWHAVFSSRYLRMALLLTPFCWGSWSEPMWWDTVIGVMPTLLGFTLGGFAVFVGIGDEKFRSMLAEPEKTPDMPTIYRVLCASFVHFILVQVIALLLALVSKGMFFKAPIPESFLALLPVLNVAWGGICYVVFLYAITSVAAIGLHIFRITTMYEKLQQISQQAGDGRNSQ